MEYRIHYRRHSVSWRKRVPAGRERRRDKRGETPTRQNTRLPFALNDCD